MHPERKEPRTRLVEGLTRDQVARRYHPKVLLVARRVHERLSTECPVELGDMISCGSIGLLEAFERFDARRGIQFSTYAEYRIRGAMYDMVREQDAFPRRRRQLAKRIDQAAREVHEQHGRPGSAEQIAAHLGIPLDAYWSAVDRVKPISHVSFDGSDDEDGRPLSEKVTDPFAGGAEQALAEQERLALVRAAIADLPDRHRQSILMYYDRGLSLAEIAAVYDVTVSRVSQILAEARAKLRKRLLPHADTLRGLDD